MRLAQILTKKTLLPFAAGLVVMATFLLFFLVERQRQADQLVSELQLQSSSFAARLETHLEARLQASTLVADHMRQSQGDRETRFRRDSALMHDLFGDLQALNWVDANGVIRIVTPEAGNAPALGLDLRRLPIPAAALAAAEDTGERQLTRPLELAQGGTGVVAYLPIEADGTLQGFLNIVFRAGPLMQSAMGDGSHEGYVIRVMDGDRLLYDSAAVEDTPRKGFETQFQAGNRIWTLQVAAGPDRLAEAAGPLDEAILLIGVVCALLGAGLTRLMLDRQHALRESRARLHDFASASSDWFWEMDADLRMSWVADGIETIFGLSPRDLIGRRRGELRVPMDDDAAWDAHQADLEAHRPFREFQYATMVHGKTKWVRVSGVPRFDEDGTFLGYRGCASDITDLVETREAVSRANARLAGAVENLDEVFSLWDADDRLTFGNRMFRVLNRNVPDVIAPGTRFEDYLRESIARGDLRDVSGRGEDFIAMRLARRHAKETTPFEVKRADGTILLLHEQPLEDGGVVTIGVDITRQRENEAALRASEERLALAVGQVSIWDWDFERGEIYFSPGFRESLGYSPEEFDAILSGDLADILHPDDVARYRAAMRAHLKGIDPTFHNELRARTRSGTYRWFLAVGQSSRAVDGTATRTSGVLTDITDRVDLEERLQQAQKMEAIGNLTGGVAHDFNNLLAVILGNLELIQETRDPDLIQCYSEAGITATRRGADLVQNMLSFARKARLEPQMLDLNSIVEDTKSWCDRVLPKAIDLDVTLGPDMPHIEADPNRVQNALLNLVVNARDAMPEGGTLGIETAHQDIAEAITDADGTRLAPGSYATLTVRDTGCGIPEADLKAIFEPFFTSKPAGSGSGLGLSMIHGFVTQSGGFVRVRSTPGKGTTFTLYFPAEDVRAAAPDLRPPTASATNSNSIFVVTEDAALRSVLCETLSTAGYDTRSASSGDAAWQDWQAHPGQDLLLTDLVLPGRLQGMHLARAVRAQNKELPVIIMSGRAEESLIQHLDPGTTRLSKPIDTAVLLRLVSESLLAGAFPENQTDDMPLRHVRQG